jgi:hypothetical protein
MLLKLYQKSNRYTKPQQQKCRTSLPPIHVSYMPRMSGGDKGRCRGPPQRETCWAEEGADLQKLQLAARPDPSAITTQAHSRAHNSRSHGRSPHNHRRHRSRAGVETLTHPPPVARVVSAAASKLAGRAS